MTERDTALVHKRARPANFPLPWRESGQRLSQTAFTLIEMMIVVVVLGALIGLLTTSLGRARQHAQRARSESDVKTLAAAMWAYRHEYGRWPCSENSGTAVTYRANNYRLWEYMTGNDEDQNPRLIRFVNWSEYLTNSSGSIVCPTSMQPYTIIFNLETDTVTVR